MFWGRSSRVFNKYQFIKVEKKSEILENFKTAIGSTVKSLSNSENVEVSFGNQNFESKNTSIKLPEIEQINNKINYSQIRALADSKSLRLRFSDNKTFKSYEPNGNISKKCLSGKVKTHYDPYHDESLAYDLTMMCSGAPIELRFYLQDGFRKRTT